jgi:hypothetical protein
MRLKDRFASKPLAFRLSSDRIGSRQGALSALPKLHGRKRGDEAVLCPMQGSVAAAESLLGKPLLQLRQPRCPHLAPIAPSADSSR